MLRIDWWQKGEKRNLRKLTQVRMMVAQFRVVMIVCGEKQLESRNILKVDQENFLIKLRKRKASRMTPSFLVLATKRRELTSTEEDRQLWQNRLWGSNSSILNMQNLRLYQIAKWKFPIWLKDQDASSGHEHIDSMWSFGYNGIVETPGAQ